jgi:hypothetical protein
MTFRAAQGPEEHHDQDLADDGRCAHAGMRGAFTRLTFPAHEPLVFLEHEHSTLIEEAKAAVEGYREVVCSLDAVSLDAEQSKALLLQLGEWLSTADPSGHVGLPPVLSANRL